LKEKSLAAHRAGIKKVLMPLDNERDLRDIPESVREELTFVPVAHMDEVLHHALREPAVPLAGSPDAEENGLVTEPPAIRATVNDEPEEIPPIGTH
jgi:ATP-dependent Lon protease